VLQDIILLSNVSQPKTTDCKVPEMRSDHHYKRRCYSMYTLHFGKTTLELNCFESPVTWTLLRQWTSVQLEY